jgi:potassium-transporting ATPase KdpC subunit
MIKQIKPALIIFFSLAILTGFIYPLVVTGLAQLLFPARANGSLVTQNGQVVGSELIGQQFDQPQYFWGRLSATADHPYNAAASGGSNYSMANPALKKQAENRISALRAADPQNSLPIPVDLVTASASGLDPDISAAAARYQAGRVARVRGLPLETVLTLVDRHTRGRMLGFLGEARVNVLGLNLALDALK